jgi:dethiobiotin synthetase
MARLLVITGTGTEVGKTHVGEAILRSLPRGVAAFGYKPVESGVTDDEGVDARRLRLASSFHVKQSLLSYAFRLPASPHLAARQSGGVVDLMAVREQTVALLDMVDLLLLELPGGLFSPLTDSALNVDLLRALPPAVTLLVAPDRLGVLHELIATTRCATSAGAVLSGVAFTAPAVADASTGTNAAEIARFISAPVLAQLPRASPGELAQSDALRALVAKLLP